MTGEQAEAEAVRRWPKASRVGFAIRLSGGCRVGVEDGEFRYIFGTGKTFEEAFANAEIREQRKDPA